MIINLTKLEEYLITLDIDKRDSMSMRHSDVMKKNIVELTELLKKIRKDLELSGESIIELDKQRVDAINERNNKYQTLRVK